MITVSRHNRQGLVSFNVTISFLGDIFPEQLDGDKIVEHQHSQHKTLTRIRGLLYHQVRMRINRNHGTKIQPATPQRRLLLSVMKEAKVHLDAKELYRRASERDPCISLATVYRNLRLFKEQGLLNERHLGQARCYYAMKQLGEHQYLVCAACGQVIEFESPLIRKLIAEVQHKNNFSVAKIELYLEGHCHKCKEEKI